MSYEETIDQNKNMKKSEHDTYRIIHISEMLMTDFTIVS